MQLTGFECPNCGASEMVQDENRRLVCTFCDTSFGEVICICPECGYYDETGAWHCPQCGGQVVRDCPDCGAGNWIVASHCEQCGRSLDLIERIARRWQETTQDRLYAQMKGMAALKAEEERASQERMAVFMDAERARQEALAQARASQRERDRQIYWLMIGAFVVLILVVGLILLLMSVAG